MFDSLKSDPKNYRANPRYPARGCVRATCRQGTLGAGDNLALFLVNLSVTGARLVVRESIAPGREVEVTLWTPGWSSVRRLAGRVVWTSPGMGGVRTIGIHFDEHLSDADLQVLGCLLGV
jgi:PilZ domain